MFFWKLLPDYTTSLAKNPINITVGVMTALMTYLIMFINLYMQTYYKQISGWKANKDSEFLPHCMSIVIINAKYELMHKKLIGNPTSFIVRGEKFE